MLYFWIKLLTVLHSLSSCLRLFALILWCWFSTWMPSYSDVSVLLILFKKGGELQELY